MLTISFQIPANDHGLQIIEALMKNLGSDAAMSASVKLTKDDKIVSSKPTLVPDTDWSGDDTEKATPKKRGRKPKSEMPVVDMDDEDDGEKSNDDEEDMFAETPKKAAAVPAKLSLDKDILPAFRRYAERTSREEAKKILAKFKVSTVRDLEEAQFEKVLKVLNN